MNRSPFTLLRQLAATVVEPDRDRRDLGRVDDHRWLPQRGGPHHHPRCSEGRQLADIVG